MDILTQGLLGAAMAQSGGRSSEHRLATVIGFGAGLLADMDVLIQSSSDPLLQIEYHRHFTHSLFFVPLGALVAALLLWPVLRRRLPFRRVFLFALLGYSLSGFLDACTSYGTYWLWPLVDERLAFNIISIVDPLFTLILLLGIIWSWRRCAPTQVRAALLLAACYLLFGWLQQERARDAMLAVIDQRGHTVEQMLVKPTMGNLLLWRSIYQIGGRFHVDAVRVGAGDARIYPGGAVEVYRPGESGQSPPVGSVLARDVQRFTDFSDGFVIRNPAHDRGLGDIRYAMLPTSLEPLWGIEFDPQHPQRHASYHFYRTLDRDVRQQFLDMLLGK